MPTKKKATKARVRKKATKDRGIPTKKKATKDMDEKKAKEETNAQPMEYIPTRNSLNFKVNVWLAWGVCASIAFEVNGSNSIMALKEIISIRLWVDYKILVPEGLIQIVDEACAFANDRRKLSEVGIGPHSPLRALQAL